MKFVDSAFITQLLSFIVKATIKKEQQLRAVSSERESMLVYVPEAREKWTSLKYPSYH